MFQTVKSYFQNIQKITTAVQIKNAHFQWNAKAHIWHSKYAQCWTNRTATSISMAILHMQFLHTDDLGGVWEECACSKTIIRATPLHSWPGYVESLCMGPGKETLAQLCWSLHQKETSQQVWNGQCKRRRVEFGWCFDRQWKVVKCIQTESKVYPWWQFRGEVQKAFRVRKTELCGKSVPANMSPTQWPHVETLLLSFEKTTRVYHWKFKNALPFAKGISFFNEIQTNTKLFSLHFISQFRSENNIFSWICLLPQTRKNIWNKNILPQKLLFEKTLLDPTLPPPTQIKCKNSLLVCPFWTPSSAHTWGMLGTTKYFDEIGRFSYCWSEVYALNFLSEATQSVFGLTCGKEKNPHSRCCTQHEEGLYLTL